MSALRLTCVSGTGTEQVVDWHELATPELADGVRSDANAWIKRLRLVPYGDRSMRARFTYGADSLWWFTELYLHKQRQLDTALLTVRALDAARARHAPARLVLSGAPWAVAAAARAWGAARGVRVETPGAGVSGRAARRREATAVRWAAVRARLLRRRARPAPARGAAFVHTAFVRERDTYIGPVLDAVAARGGPGALALIGVGPRRTFAAAGAAAGPLPAALTPLEALSSLADLRPAVALWRDREALAGALTRGDAIRDAARVDDVDLWEVLCDQLHGAATVQWPWSARLIEESAAAIAALSPKTVTTYAEAGGVGRALIIAARRLGVRSVGLQHGFIYRHWLNYRHEPDEMAPEGPDPGAPIPAVTLAFDGYAEAYLRDAGAFPADAVQVTGSARLEVLTRRLAGTTPAERQATRADVDAAGADHKLVVLAAKFSEIRDDLPMLLAGLAPLPDVRLVIKAHPAETAEVYAPVVAGHPGVRVVGADADLALLIAAADLIVSKNSTVAIDGLALGIPALIIGLPNNLSPFVDAGVMLGATTTEATTGALRAVLYDQQVRTRLAAAADAFASQYGLRSQPGATERAADHILALD